MSVKHVRMFGGPADGKVIPVESGRYIKVPVLPKVSWRPCEAGFNTKPSACVDIIEYKIHTTDAWGTQFDFATLTEERRIHVENSITLIVWMALTADGWRKERETVATGRYVS